MKNKSLDTEKLKFIFVPCSTKSKGGKFHFKRAPLLACMIKCKSDLEIHEKCVGCTQWLEHVPIERKKIHYKIHYYIEY